MFIAHLPVGYLVSRLPCIQPNAKWLMLGSVLPDLDIVWFHLVDAGAVHHHSYLTHRPLFWGIVLFVAMGVRSRAASVLAIGALLHVVLDSIAGAIDWGWPFTEFQITLTEVPATYDWWVWSFLTHPSFAIEIAICIVAAYVFRMHKS